MGEFVHLHLHTQYSLLDGGIRIDKLFKRAKELDFKAIAITDHGNLFGVVRFYQEAQNVGIKPIIGCEMYVAPGSRFEKKTGLADSSYHLTLLVKDKEGYKNLIKLASLAYLEGFYYKPRVDKELLKKYSKGLIALSGCLKGEIPQALLKGKYHEAKNIAQEYLSIFGEGNFYLEIMRVGIEEENTVNPGLIDLSKELGIPLVATNDCHYIYPDDALAHEVLMCIQTGKRLEDTNRMKLSTDKLYIRSKEEMYRLFADVEEAVKNTVEIAEKCNFTFDFSQKHLPAFEVPCGHDVNSYLKELAFEGLRKRKERGELDPERNFKEYEERLKYELEIIEKLGFSGYFLIVWDFVNFAKRNNIPVGPGRGSAAGSLVSYVLEITDIDPLRWELLFERFLNPERVSMPDIDIDFCMERRDEVFEYIKRKYGENNVAKIITFGSLSARAVVRDVGRVLGFSPKEVDKIAKLIPQSQSITIEEAVSLEPKLQKLIEENEKIKQLIEIAKKLEGLSRHMSIHAAGIVITPKELTEYIPLCKSEKEGEITTQYAKDELEALGLLKMDLLGLKTLTVIDTALKLIKLYKKTEIDLKKIPLDDPETYRLLQSGATFGVFQLESSGMRDLLRKLKPSRFEDLIALVALYRPGPLGSGMVDEFIARKHGKKPIKYEPEELSEKLEPILKETYGVILYQEQVMKIAEAVAGFTLAEADILRKAMGKKKADLMAEMREKFVNGAVERGVTKKHAEELFDKMAKFAEYGFNKSHSAAYAMVAYQTAFLKAHYPVEFMAALISSEITKPDKIYLYIQECKEMGISILPPDINESDVIFKVDGKSLRFGLAAVKGVGEAAAETIVKERKNGPYKSIYDFCKRVVGQKVNKKTIEVLIKAGAFDSLGIDRKALLIHLDEIVEKAQKAQKKKDKKQISLFDISPEIIQEEEPEIPEDEKATFSEILSMEKESLGFYLSGHPLDVYKEKLKEYTLTGTAQLDEKEDGEEVIIAGMVISIKEIATRNGERMAFVNLEDKEGRIEVVVFPDVYKECDLILAMEEPVLIRGTVSTDAGSETKKILATEVALLKEGLKKETKPEEPKILKCVVEIPDKTPESALNLLAQIAKENPGEYPLEIKIINDVYEVEVDTGMKVAENFLSLCKKFNIVCRLKVENGKTVGI